MVELLSPGTEREDLGQTVPSADEPPTKWQVYEQILRVPYYVVFSRYTNEMQAFQLMGASYKPIELTAKSLPIAELQLSLGLWQGSYRGVERLWLRWFTQQGELIPLDSEELESAQQEVATAKQEAAAATQRAEQLAAKLRELGIDPDAIQE